MQTTDIIEQQEPVIDFETSIESALEYIGYPPEETGYPPLNQIQKGFLSLKIFNLKQFLHTYCANKTQIEDGLHLSPEKLQRIAHEFSALVLPRPVITAFDLQQELVKKGTVLSFGCPVLDNLLNGGIRTNQLTEISGESASAKSQFCIQLCIQVQLPLLLGGLEGSAIYLSTENGISIKRLNDIADAYITKMRDLKIDNLPKRRKELTDNIFVKNIQSLDQFEEMLTKLLPHFCKSHGNIRLIVIDSIAAIYRVEYDHDTKDMMKRTNDLFRHANMLKTLADELQACIVIVNQVTDDIEQQNVFSVDDSGGHHSQMDMDIVYSTVSDLFKQRKVKPALGLGWSNCINTRIFLTRRPMGYNEQHSFKELSNKKQKMNDGGCIRLQSYNLKDVPLQDVKRQMHVIFSPFAPNASCTFIITDEGIRGII